MWEQFTLYQQASYTGKQCGHLQADASLPPQDTSHWEGLYPLLATVYTQKTPWHRVKDTPAVAAQHSLDTALDEWIQRYPSDASVWLSKAFVLFQANHLLQAKLATEQALTLEPHHQGALLLYADLLKAEGNPKQAYLYLKRVVALNEQSPPAKQALLQLQAYD
jgi:tetratricopeptide (TPR) repeat protein